jgi:hypothetical protein
MRNIAQSPLNADDVFGALENAIKDYEAKNSFGSTNGLVLHKLTEFLKDEENMNKFLEFAKKKNN